MTRPDETRVEREVRQALARLDPGPAPRALRERALDVPATTPSSVARRWSAAPGVLGVAAAVVLAVAAFGVIGRPAPNAAASNAPGGVASASTAAPTPTSSLLPPASTDPASPATRFGTVQTGAGPAFDLNVEGPGLTRHADDGNLLRVVILLAAAVAATVGFDRWRKRRRVAAAASAASGALVLWVAVASLAPVNLGTNGGGPGVYTAFADQPFGYSESIMFEVAPYGEHFTVGINNAGGQALVPARL